MSCKNYNNIDGEKYYGVEFKCAINLEDIKVQHEAGKSNDDVDVVHIYNYNLSKVPQGLTKIFPNLIILNIFYSNLKSLSKIDLVEYKKLRGIYFDGNQLEFLPGDLFVDFQNLEWISFYDNKLKVIEPSILDGLDKLKFVNFRENPNFDKSCMFTIYFHQQPKVTIQDLKNQLSEKFFSTGKEKFKKFIEKCEKNAKRFEIDPKLETQGLYSKIHILMAENQNFAEEVRRLTKENQGLKHSNIVSDLKSHIADENFKDFKIEIDGHEFLVHKLLLTIRSSTMAEMLRNNPETENLKLVDIPVNVFEVIVNFLYTDELPHDNNIDYMELFAAASHLKIEKLRNLTATRFYVQINQENAVEVYKLGIKYDHDGLRQKAFEEIKKCYENIKFKDEWSTDVDKVMEIVQAAEKLKSLMDE